MCSSKEGGTSIIIHCFSKSCREDVVQVVIISVKIGLVQITLKYASLIRLRLNGVCEATPLVFRGVINFFAVGGVLSFGVSIESSF